MKYDVEEVIHLNDLSFIRLCNEKYGINKGIYNTIDSWFYKHGIKNILDRRRYILSFLEFLMKRLKTNTRIKFGHGGLSVRLQEYFFEQVQQPV
ncbi:hypothetical protein [Pseudalkalibacillus decolorationis]|uniref:hypothetical protein n=1 Tax=Pseudalkalibacillus decolorationis TaxID=163879 RepID=UPI002148A42E|nr:hypothetical protein [Pseudalkalibacillus decolorationis]